MMQSDPDPGIRLMHPTPRQVAELVRWLAKGK
jgi:hypothetical protein